MDLCIHTSRTHTVLEKAKDQTCPTSGCWGCHILGSISLLAFFVSDHQVSRARSEVYSRLAPFVSLKLYVLFRKSKSYEERLSSLSLISLKNYLVVFSGSTACTEGLKLLREASKILIFVIDALHNRCWFSEFACFAAYFYALLVFADFSAHADVFGKPTCRTDFCHVTQLAKEGRQYLRFSTYKAALDCMESQDWQLGFPFLFTFNPDSLSKDFQSL